MEESYFKTQYDDHGVKLLSEIFSWYVNKTLPDVILHVENRQIEAHKLILGASSTFFKSIFCTRDRKDFYFEDISYRTMGAIVEYMYTGELVVDWELMPECLKLADCLMIRGLSKLYSHESVNEPAAVSQEMLEAILVIGQTRPCAEIQENDSTQVSQTFGESWQKHTNLPKLQLKRDAKTGNWISKNDDLAMDFNGNTNAKPTTKRKPLEMNSKETKLTKQIYDQSEDLENVTAEKLSPSEGYSTAPDCSGLHHQYLTTALPQDNVKNFESSVAELKPTMNAPFFPEEYLVTASLESFSNPTSGILTNTGNTKTTTVQPMKIKNDSTTLSASIPDNSIQTNKKRNPEINGKVAYKTPKNASKTVKEPTHKVPKTKQQGMSLKKKEPKTSIVCRSKPKQKSVPTTSSTASKATDLLIKKLFNDRSFQRNPEAAQQHHNLKPPKQTAVLTNLSATSIAATNGISPKTPSTTNPCHFPEELENGLVIKTDANEPATTNAKQINRLANRCKVSDWHIDESEVLECDEEYEQNKNAPCPQPAEFIKTEKLVYGCPSCNKAYTLKSNYRRHYVVTHRRQDMPVYKCPICDSRFTRTDNRNSHIRKIHDFADPIAVQAWNHPFYMCALCKKGFYNDNDLQNHLRTEHPPSRNSYFGRIA